MRKTGYLKRDRVAGYREFLLPERMPKPGQVYEFAREATTIGGHIYGVGDSVKLIQRTKDAPFGWHSSVGNWLAETKYGVSVWSSIDEMVAHDQLQLVDVGDPPRSLYDHINDLPD